MAKEIEVGQESKLKMTIKDWIIAIGAVVMIMGVWYNMNLRVSILEERYSVISKDFSEMKNKVDKIYDIVIKLEK